MLFDRRQLPVERLSRQKIFELGRFGSKVFAYIRFTAEEGPRASQRIARPIKVLQARFRQCLIQLGGAFDCILIDRCDALNVAIALSSEPRRTAFICPIAPSRTAAPEAVTRLAGRAPM